MKFSAAIVALCISHAAACANQGHFCTNGGATDCECNGGHLLKCVPVEGLSGQFPVAYAWFNVQNCPKVGNDLQRVNGKCLH
ncbi:hypothetical protein VHEMI03296 [[Torrubiella] hemipterigena]|uniref:Uncharacterized protein n=1 Tax=[Torrubiella] hemipterigena TaxID=1531966 RepID=A0A0A1SS71_9HYPO|nr:hypothetical protein VHEMI03296 [[Torrubiella] hemipterigena]